MKFNQKLIEEILSDYSEEDFDNQVKKTFQVTSVMAKNLGRAIDEYDIKESPVFIASKAIALYIELVIKNDHPEKDMIYYYMRDRLEIDKTGKKGWKLYNVDMFKNFLKYAELYFQGEKFKYDIGDFFEDFTTLTDFKKYMHMQDFYIFNVRFKIWV